MRWIIFLLLLFYSTGLSENLNIEKKDTPNYFTIKVLTTSYFAHKGSDYGCYRRVTKNQKRMGNFIALNFLPGGSIVMIPALFKTTTFEVADTFGGSGVGYFKGEKYWKVDILKNKNEWHENIDYPIDLYVVKFNEKGPVKNKTVKNNTLSILQKIKANNK
ncbi:hypothetical protein A3J90_08885 [candidate division WOR-1 bacterium RIFOXYC2_FULL_37_10]|uniref:3D domain-containing protein n=1 Tax=candidate division WOR-1 bacterium RIFOXYB2_FULL_37_13 TaxID=1802579 RepID=A0A1F4SUV2_UNCSA|nr:MAG: hypothetical protein A2246_03450 [candidate division WOR-1 bacterium RIFOXYA2_FULL_37_7]OGC24206.1 MAG: hypothetical protein A2310_06645 [candidate division WOR-1 bacterium RIFOXYB2_FULL_37_13]OGC36567.1 MAG: hypothetical protein A3J90_08885 [candidate division WOR-1 bacterium RIFOXYC2_FULL_37_10]